MNVGMSRFKLLKRLYLFMSTTQYRIHTIWLSHSSVTTSCRAFDDDFFASVSDITLGQLNEGLGTSAAYVKLESVLEFMNI